MSDIRDLHTFVKFRFVVIDKNPRYNTDTEIIANMYVYSSKNRCLAGVKAMYDGFIKRPELLEVYAIPNDRYEFYKPSLKNEVNRLDQVSYDSIVEHGYRLTTTDTIRLQLAKNSHNKYVLISFLDFWCIKCNKKDMNELARSLNIKYPGTVKINKPSNLLSMQLAHLPADKQVKYNLKHGVAILQDLEFESWVETEIVDGMFDKCGWCVLCNETTTQTNRCILIYETNIPQLIRENDCINIMNQINDRLESCFDSNELLPITYYRFENYHGALREEFYRKMKTNNSLGMSFISQDEFQHIRINAQQFAECGFINLTPTL